MKRTLLLSLCLVFCFLMAAARHYPNPTDNLPLKLKNHARSLLAYARQHGYNTQTCFLIDMSIEPGKKRFFVYDLKKDSVIDSGLVSHGACRSQGLVVRQYGNAMGCGCTSLGKYKIGNAYKGKYGLAYKLHGLDATNSNALKRLIVMHAHYCVPDEEVSPEPICQSDGCPMVSESMLKKLAIIIDQSKQPVLLSIFDQN